MQWLKQSTAATVKLRADSGQTLGQAAVRLSKNGGDYAQSHNSAGATYDEGNQYDVPLDTTDTATCGRLTAYLNGTGFVPADFMVVPANVFDSLMLGTDTLEVEATGIVTIDEATITELLAIAVPMSNDANTIGDCLNAARAQGFGKWALNSATKILTLYAGDDTTIVAELLLGPNLSAPLTRTPQ